MPKERIPRSALSIRTAVALGGAAAGIRGWAVGGVGIELSNQEGDSVGHRLDRSPVLLQRRLLRHHARCRLL